LTLIKFFCVQPCPCGWLNDPQKAFGCASTVVTKYPKRISGPILDHIDIHIEVPIVDYEKLSSDRVEESSESTCARVQVRDIQLSHVSKIEVSEIVCNANMYGEASPLQPLRELRWSHPTELHKYGLHILFWKYMAELHGALNRGSYEKQPIMETMTRN